MQTGRGTDRRTVRVDDDLWERYRRACEADDTNRGSDLRAHMRAKVKRWESRQQRSA